MMPHISNPVERAQVLAYLKSRVDAWCLEAVQAEDWTEARIARAKASSLEQVAHDIEAEAFVATMTDWTWG